VTVQVAKAARAIKGTPITRSVLFTEGSRVITLAPLDRHGQAKLTTGTLRALDHQLVATYQGDAFCGCAPTARPVR
jgi:hypothetical protein